MSDSTKPLNQINGKETLDFLLADESRRVPALDLYGKQFEIGIYRNEFGLLIATGYRDGREIEGINGVILSPSQCCSWLEDAGLKR